MGWHAVAAGKAANGGLSRRDDELLKNLFQRCLLYTSGEFGADMKIDLVNDGPVTIVIDTDEWKK